MSSSITNPDPDTYDALEFSPPCESDNPYCSHKCPYWCVCELLAEDDDEDF